MAVLWEPSFHLTAAKATTGKEPAVSLYSLIETENGERKKSFRALKPSIKPFRTEAAGHFPGETAQGKRMLRG